jgi:hypothetical protein
MNTTGRAPVGAITLSRRADRAVDELVGLCRGLLADGHVNQQEAEFLKSWIERNADFVGMYPFDRIYRQLTDIMRDGFLDQDESADLMDTLVRFVGGEASDHRAETASLSTALPLDDPEPVIVYPDSIFVVTGTFSYGVRSLVCAEIESRGGISGASPTKKTRYLIIGDLGSRDWKHSNCGAKIERAIQLRDEGCQLAIVSERHWAATLL